MEDWQKYLIAFGIFNLCLLLFCRQLSGIVLGFFSFGRTICPPEVAEKQATRMGFSGVFSNPEVSNPSRKQVIQFLGRSGGINFLGCVALYIAITSGLFDNQQGEQDSTHQSTTRSESKSE